MSVIAECLVERSGFPVGQGVTVPEGVTVEVERVVPTEGHLLPYLWARGRADAVDEFVRDAAAAPAVETISVVDRLDDGVLCRVEWTGDGPALPRRIAAEGVSLLEITGRADGWLFRIRSPDRARVERLHDYCLEMEMQFELMRIYDLSKVEDGPPYELTAEQYEALVSAYREGYYDEPRGTTLETLGESFDITARAVSRRLRRGTATLVRNALGVDRG